VAWIENPVFLILLRILVASAFVAAVYFLTKYLSRLLDRAMSSIDRRVRREVEEVVKYIIYVIAALIAVAIISPEVSILTTLLLLVGLAIIVAFSDYLRNWGSQYFMRGTGFAKIGDWIEVEHHYGRVVEDTGSGVVLETPKRERVFIPYSKLVSSIIVNRTTQIGSIHSISIIVPKTRNPLEVMEKLKEISDAVRAELVSNPEISMKAEKDEYAFEISMEIMNVAKIPIIEEEVIRNVMAAFPEAKIITA